MAARSRPSRRSATTAALLLALACAALLLAQAQAAAAAGSSAANATATAAPAATAAAPSGADRPWEWSWRTGVAVACSVAISLVIAPGGSGGAQLYYPLFNVLLGFSIRDTAAIVSFVMLLGAIMSCGMAVAERHPTDPARRPVIDYGSVLVVSPAVLLGVALGVIANAILPLWLLQAASIAVFSWAFVRILLPYLALRAKERARDAAASAAAGEVRAVVVVAAGEAGVSGDASSADVAITIEQPAATKGAPQTLGALERAGDSALLHAAAAALAADALGRAASAGVASPTAAAAAPPAAAAATSPFAAAAAPAPGVAAFCALDAEVRSLEAAALDDFPLAVAPSRAFTRDPDTLLMIAAVDAARAASLPHARARADGAAPFSRAASVSAAPGARAVLSVTAAAGHAAIKLDAPPAASEEEGEAAAADGAVPSALAAYVARVREWGRRQPKLLICLTLAVLAQQVAFSVLQKAVVAPCTGGYYGLLAARAAVTVALAVGAAAVVRRAQRREREEQRQEQPEAAAAGAPPALEQGLGGAQAGGRAAPRAAREASREAARRRNWAAIQWGGRDIIEKNLAMLAIGVLGGSLGLGGGFAIAPLLLGMGLHPQCQAGTSKAILLISTLASSLGFLIAGRMALTYALVFGCINLLVTPIGIVVTNAAIRRTGRPSLLVALNAASYGAGVVLLLAMSGIPGWVATARGQVPAGFDMANLCSA